MDFIALSRTRVRVTQFISRRCHIIVSFVNIKRTFLEFEFCNVVVAESSLNEGSFWIRMSFFSSERYNKGNCNGPYLYCTPALASSH